MRTPDEYTNNLKNKIITGKMLEDALVSVNKRAKNWRDRKRECKNSYYSIIYSNKAEKSEKEMYAYKDKLLSVLDPVCIHIEDGGYERIRVFDYQDDYIDKLIEHIIKGDIVWQNSYYDYDSDEVVCFFDYLDKTKPIYRYYLYYEIGYHSFHTPIAEGDVRKSSIEQIHIGRLETEGADIEGLVSMAFVKKLIELINAGNYKFIPNETKIIPFSYNKIEDNRYNPYNAINLWREYEVIVSEAILREIQPMLPEYKITETDKSQIKESVLHKTKNAINKQLTRKDRLERRAAKKNKTPKHPVQVSYQLRVDNYGGKKYGNLPMSYNIINNLHDFCEQNGYTFNSYVRFFFSGHHSEIMEACLPNMKNTVFNKYIAQNRERWINEYNDTGDFTV